jgi:hypothetical protein
LPFKPVGKKSSIEMPLMTWTFLINWQVIKDVGGLDMKSLTFDPRHCFRNWPQVCAVATWIVMGSIAD